MKTLTANPYKSKILLFRGMSPEKFKKDLVKSVPKSWHHIAEQIKPNHLGKTWYRSGSVIIWCRSKSLTTLVHELLHATTYILDYKGVPISQDNDECMAYLQGYLLTQALGLKNG